MVELLAAAPGAAPPTSAFPHPSQPASDDARRHRRDAVAERLCDMLVAAVSGCENELLFGARRLPDEQDRKAAPGA